MSLSAATIADSISKLSVSGVTIKDVDQIPNEVTQYDVPVMFPEPLNFITDFEVIRDSFGADSLAKKTAAYTLNYTFCHSLVGSGRLLSDVYDDMVAKAELILDAIIANSTITGAVDIEPLNISNFGVVLDPAGHSFHGCQIQVRVMEFING